jgi:hypothetical protein
MANLVVLKPYKKDGINLSNKKVAIPDEPLLIGRFDLLHVSIKTDFRRGDNCYLRIMNEAVSEIHACIEKQNDKVYFSPNQFFLILY